jgi:hypothetical protein
MLWAYFMTIYFKVQVNVKNGVEKKSGKIRGQANNTFPLNSKVSPEFDMSFPWERQSPDWLFESRKAFSGSKHLYDYKIYILDTPIQI